MNAPNPNPNPNPNVTASQREAWERAIGYYSVYPTVDLMINTYKQCFNITDTTPQIIASIPNNYFPRRNQPWASAPPHAPPHQNPSSAKQQKECVNADVDEIQRRGDAGVLNLRAVSSNGSTVFIPVPPLSDNDHHYNNQLLDIGKAYHPTSFLTSTLKNNYIKKFHRHATSSVCLDKKWNFYHATASPVDVDLVNGSTEPISIVPAAVELDTSKQIDWDDVRVGNLDQAERVARAQLWDTSNGQSLSEPLPPNLRSHPSVSHSYPSKQRCPSKAECQQFLTESGYRTLIEEHATICLSMADGGDAYMAWMHGLPCIMPSIMQSLDTLIANPKHFNKRAFEVGSGNMMYQEIRDDYDDDENIDHLNERVTRMHEIATERILPHVQSDEFANRESYGSFDHWYASSSILGAAVFILTHDECGSRKLHYPSETEEFSKSAMIQILAHRDLERVKAKGLDYTNIDGHKHIIRGRMPIPVVASYHVEWGPPEHPILGATFTILDECYRPTMGNGVVKFSYA
eukprot:scaffold10033_cov116-Skeletonema_dohrnii-CCMP3373.AAC.4